MSMDLAAKIALYNNVTSFGAIVISAIGILMNVPLFLVLSRNMDSSNYHETISVLKVICDMVTLFLYILEISLSYGPSATNIVANHQACQVLGFTGTFATCLSLYITFLIPVIPFVIIVRRSRNFNSLFLNRVMLVFAFVTSLLVALSIFFYGERYRPLFGSYCWCDIFPNLSYGSKETLMTILSVGILPCPITIYFYYCIWQNLAAIKTESAQLATQKLQVLISEQGFAALVLFVFGFSIPGVSIICCVFLSNYPPVLPTLVCWFIISHTVANPLAHMYSNPKVYNAIYFMRGYSQTEIEDMNNRRLAQGRIEVPFLLRYFMRRESIRLSVPALYPGTVLMPREIDLAPTGTVLMYHLPVEIPKNVSKQIDLPTMKVNSDFRNNKESESPARQLLNLGVLSHSETLDTGVAIKELS